MKVNFEVTASDVNVKASYDKKLLVEICGADLEELIERVGESSVLASMGEKTIAFWFNQNSKLDIKKFFDNCYHDDLAEYLQTKGWTVSKES
ncbi:hypothetical protein E2G82_21040 [Salmonella enterica subsp. enterica serovar Ramatgan]|nr:hypothetical protein [Salmonella enterica subsp. enterica serovar Ramatgan]EHP1586491.1 hypothetical protein [Salmonella enterica]